MKNRKTVILAVAIVAIVGISIFNSTLFRTPRVGFYGVSPKDNSVLIDFLDGKEGFGKDVSVIEYDSSKTLYSELRNSPVDMVIVKDIPSNSSLNKLLTPIPSTVLSTIPTTFRSKLFVPMELDSLEFLFDRRIYGDIVDDNGVISDFTKLEDRLLAQREENRYPLVVSGGDNQSFLDFISVISLSMVGTKGYNKLQQLLLESDNLSNIMDTVLDNNISLKNILDKINKWRELGILHPEWSSFTKDDSHSFIKDGLSSATIIRLSEHRTLDNITLRYMDESLFPFVHESDRGSNMVVSTYTLGIVKKSRFRDEIISLLRLLYSDNWQKKITYRSGLAPVTYTAEAMDRQASNARLWGASSLEISKPLNISNIKNLDFMYKYLK